MGSARRAAGSPMASRRARRRGPGQRGLASIESPDSNSTPASRNRSQGLLAARRLGLAALGLLPRLPDAALGLLGIRLHRLGVGARIERRLLLAEGEVDLPERQVAVIVPLIAHRLREFVLRP